MIMVVAAYARVSTEKEDQVNSLVNQKEYFESYIQSHSDWQYGGVYYDEGITGTQTKKRTGFNKMIEECRRGNINLILTKEVSRFARNTVDTLNYTRMLRGLGVGVVFINDNIDTRDNDGEFRLSIMASVAQEESRKTSERVRWGQRRAMEKGVVFGNNSIFGFDIKDGALYINEREAEIVRHIFHKYINEGKGSCVIARELHEENISPPMGRSELWSSTMILRILRNEKYAGDLLQKKYITNDYITHRKRINDGEKIFIKNHHEPIIERDLWERTQNELKRRTELKGTRHSNRYWCSGKVVCGRCNAKFVMRKSRKKCGIYESWSHYNNSAKRCNMRTVNNKSLLECTRYAVDMLGVDFNKMAEQLISEIKGLNENVDINNIEKMIQETERKKMRILDGYFSQTISAEEMEILKKACDEEKARLCVRLKNLCDVEKNQSDILSIRNFIVDNAVKSEILYSELLDRIMVFDEYLIIRIKGLDFSYKIRYSTHGYKENYTTVIEECSMEKSE